jgi:hypothetical protein
MTTCLGNYNTESVKSALCATMKYVKEGIGTLCYDEIYTESYNNSNVAK